MDAKTKISLSLECLHESSQNFCVKSESDLSTEHSRAPVSIPSYSYTQSAPSSPSDKTHRALDVRSLINKFEKRSITMAAIAEKEADMILRDIRNNKRWVTKHLDDMKKLQANNTLTETLFYEYKLLIMRKFDDLEKSDAQASEIYERHKAESAYIPDSDTLADFMSQNRIAMIKIQDQIKVVKPVAPAAPISSNAFKLKLDINEFLGDESDVLGFANWLMRFETLMSSGGFDAAAKAFFLKNKVRGNAASYIDSINPDAALAYDRMVSALKEQYMNEDLILAAYFREFRDSKPEFDHSYGKTRVFISDVRNKLYNLKTHFGVDLLKDQSCETDGCPGGAGHKLVSFLIFDHFSPELKEAFVRECGTLSPTFNQIIDKYAKVINTISQIRRKPKEIPNNQSKRANFPAKSTVLPNPAKSNSATSNSKSEPNFSTQSSKSKGHLQYKLHCKFCGSDGHYNKICTLFKTYQQRVDKCIQAGLCTTCASHMHPTSDCPGKSAGLHCYSCHSKNHTSALCPKGVETKKSPDSSNVCHSANVGMESCFLLPIIALKVIGPNKKVTTLNVLVDTGCHRTYFNANAATLMGVNLDAMRESYYDITTFLGSGTKKMGLTRATVILPHRRINLPFHVDKNFSLQLKVRGLGQLVQNLIKAKVPLAANYPTKSNTMTLDGLIGNDVLQFMPFKTVPCMHGQAFNFAGKICPYGNTEHFLFRGQVPAPQSIRIENNFNTIMRDVKCSPRLVDECLEPKETYPDDLAVMFDTSMVERRIERMLECDNAGVQEVPEQNTYDQDNIQKFRDGIEVKDYVYINLIWKDNIKDVPSNHQVALKVMQRVYADLERKDLVLQYNQVFFDQHASDIISEFECSPDQYANYIWLPHRPVIKNDPQTSTKIRPVFNASVKPYKNKPSLNQASYAGVNNMQDMLKLLMLFRTNSKVLLGDLEKAFLQIRLRRMDDRNKFCFFIKDGQRIRYFKYNTLLFGFICSPFILNYVVQHLASLHPDDACSRMIRSKFFVDNLVHTGNSTEELIELYQESARRLGAAHFNLQSCNSNDSVLRDLMIKDNRYVKHGCQLDKVLGYKYDAISDIIKISQVTLNELAKTKRTVLAESSKVFDPLSLGAPVSVRSKILLAKLWKFKPDTNHWDEEISGEDQNTWNKICSDLNKLGDLDFPRNTFSQEEEIDLYIFCDASRQAYGATLYAKQGGESNLIFAKAKVAPKKPRTLPQLELLSALLGLQALASFTNTFSKISKVFLAVDAQIVLSWLTSPINTKNVYTANRLKEFSVLKEKLSNQGLDIQLKYVPTNMNPCDLLTRGLTYESFCEQKEFWIHGPDWLRTASEVSWPKVELNCLNETSKQLVCATQVQEVLSQSSRLVNFDKFSKWTKLVRTTFFVLKFLTLRKVLSQDTLRKFWGTTDLQECAQIINIKRMQREAFPKEIEFLQGAGHGTVPDRVRDMNLTIDQWGLVRSEGRMNNAVGLDQGLIKPIVLARNHYITNLLIYYAHQKVSHLGIQPTLNLLTNQGFRLINPINSTKAVLRQCFTCRKMNNLTYKYPRMTNLPACRVNLIRPYAFTGLDYTGSILVKEGDVFHKFYLLIYTCLNVRSVHIDLLPDMSTEQFVLSLVRFCNQYGTPETLYSDNASTFKAGSIKLSKVMESDLFKEHFAGENIKHNYIPLGAPWVGSCWERQIATIKSCLKKVVGRQKLGFFHLKTVLSDIQRAINCRPLTYRCADNNSLEVISPINFLNPYGVHNLLVRNADLKTPRSNTNKELDAMLRLRDELLDKFKTIWHQEYLSGLRNSYKNLRQENFKDVIKVGDVVLIKNIQPKFIKSRQFWSLGRIVKLHVGSDGHFRSAAVLRGTADYRTHKRELEVHPLNHLYPLELTVTHDHKTPVTQEELDMADIPVSHDLNSGTNQIQAPIGHTNENNSGENDPNIPQFSSRGRLLKPRKLD